MLKARNRCSTRLAILSACILFPALSSFAHAADHIDTTLPPAIEKIMALPEEQIDIGIAALTFAQDIYPGIDVQAYSKKIDEIVSQVKAATAGNADPDFRIKTMNDVIYRQRGFRYVDAKGDQHGGKATEDFYLNNLLDKRQGNCFSMPLLYMAIAQRLGYPVYSVETPDHFFLRYLAPGRKPINIEATSGGGNGPDWKYIQDLNIPEKGIKSGAYMRTLTHRETLAALLMTNGIYVQARDKDYASGVPYFERAELLNPYNANLAKNLSGVYSRIAKNAERAGAARALRFCNEKVQFYEARATDLGFQKGDW